MNERSGFTALKKCAGWLLACAMLTAGPALAAAPSSVSFTLEGCRNDGTPLITLPNGSGDFICPTAAYTTGNLGKGWSELDLVPHRLTAKAGQSAPASQIYTVAVVLDHFDVGHPGYDVLSAPKLNTSLSDASCTAPVVGSESILAPGLGGIDESIYRLVTITQAKNTSCVYDYYGRLALGSHLFRGASLHANLADENLDTGGIGARDVSIPVKEIKPQELKKDMSATQDKDHHWTLTKEPSPATISFGDVCVAGAPQPQNVTFRVTWERLAATPGTILVVTHVYAKNPATRTITVDVTDKIYQGTTQTVLLDTAVSGPIDVPANTEMLVLTHTVELPASANVDGSLNDVATATYTDKVTGVPVPGTTEAKASATIEIGTVTDATAGIRDVESMTGTGLTFSVLDPGLGQFVGYTPGTPTTGPVKWGSGAQTAGGFVDFAKTIYLDAARVTSGNLTDTANLLASDGFTVSAGPINVGITSSASVKLTIDKTIPKGLDAGEKIEITFHITRKDDPKYSRDETLTFVYPSVNESVELTGLVPDLYTIEETSAWFYPAGCGDTSCRIAAPLVPDGGTQQNVDLALKDGVVSACAGTASYNNVVPDIKFAEAQVQKVTSPVLESSDPAYSWEFKLYGPGGGTALATVNAGAGAGFVNFGVDLTVEGTYTVVETQKSPTWVLNSATPNDGINTTVCSFTVDYFDDVGKVFGCTFINTKQGQAKVIKTVKEGVPTGTQAFTFQLRQGASTISNGTTLESLVANAGNGGVINFTTLLVPGNTSAYQLCEIVMPGWMSTLGTFVPNSFMPPNGIPTNPNVDNSIVCVDFTVQPGETKTFTVDNSPPPGGRGLTIGFWKNWASCKAGGGNQKAVLDQTMAKATLPGIQVDSFYLLGDPSNPDVAPDCKKAVNLLDKSSFYSCKGGSKKMASDPLFNMAAQLVAAELNLAAGAYSCGKVLTAITTANNLLTYYKFDGCTHTAMTAGDATLANTTAARLDDYNNNRPAACQ